MGRHTLPIEQKKIAQPSTISLQLKAIVEALAVEKDWRPAKAAANLMEAGAKELGLYDKYQAQIELAQRAAKVAA